MARKKLYKKYCDKCGSKHKLELSTYKIQAKCDICGKNKLCTNAEAIRKADAEAKKKAEEALKKEKAEAKKAAKNGKKVAPKKAETPKPTIPEQVLSVLKGAPKGGMTSDMIVAALPKGLNAGSVRSAITRMVKKGTIKKLKTKITSTDGKKETAYSAK